MTLVRRALALFGALRSDRADDTAKGSKEDRINDRLRRYAA